MLVLAIKQNIKATTYTTFFWILMKNLLDFDLRLFRELENPHLLFELLCCRNFARIHFLSTKQPLIPPPRDILSPGGGMRGISCTACL
jgi:hypothetical protein